MPAAPRSVLLIQDRRFGDVALTTALLEDIAAAWPHAGIDFLVGAPAAPMLRHHPLIREVVVLDKSRVVAFWREIRRRGYEAVIDVQGNPRTAMITRATGAALRVGWAVRGYAWVYTHRVARSRGAMYVVRDRQRLLQAAGIATHATLPRLYVTAEERAVALRRLAELDAAAALPARTHAAPDARAGAAYAARVGLQLSTAEPAKQWPIAHFVTLSRALAAAGLRPTVFAGPGDEERIAAFRAAGGVGTIAPSEGLRSFMAMLVECAVFVSGDTGPAHMATALDVPRVTLYGPTDPRAWDPGVRTISLRNEAVSCDGCFVHRCVRDGACMIGLVPARVLDAVLELAMR